MDLRGKLTAEEAERALLLLSHQPFILSDAIQTGVAYSWYEVDDERIEPPLIFRRDQWRDQWDKISDFNGRLRALYDDILDELAARFPGGSMLDVACNNGYFPIGAELRGMRGTGLDMRDFTATFDLLNKALGTQATFLARSYDSRTHKLPIADRFDICVASAITCHLPDPLYFLAELARVADKAILFFGQVVNTDALLVSYFPPHPSLSGLTDFPHSFNDNTRFSMGMFKESMRLCGFSTVIEIPWRPTWPPGVFEQRHSDLETELNEGSRHVVLLATR